MVASIAQEASVSAKPAFTTGSCELFGGTKDGLSPWLGDSVEETNVNANVWTKVKVEDIRSWKVKPTITNDGFEFANYPSKFTREQLLTIPTDEGIQKVIPGYYEECRDLLLQQTGADKVVCFRHGFRVEQDTDPNKQFAACGPQAKVRGVSTQLHCDWNPELGIALLKKTMGAEKFEEAMKTYKRIHVVNVWRPIQKIERYPLLLVDTTEMTDFDYEKDFVRLEMRNSRGGYKIALKPNDKYRYYYTSNQSPDEALIFRDCAVTGEHGLLAHGAFWDHNTRPDAPFRESIEVRAVVFYKE